MEYPVIHMGQTVGHCTVTDQGLYWLVECCCEILSDRVERLYCGADRLAVLEQDGNTLTCRRMVSKKSVPALEQINQFSLSPYDVWNGRLLEQPIQCMRQEDVLLFPYRPEEPCPCEPLICFFEIKDGFWRLRLQPEWIGSVGEDSSGT